MNYYCLVRYSTAILFVLACYIPGKIALKKNPNLEIKRNRITRVIVSAILVIIELFILLFPYDKYIIRFKSVEKIFNYYHTGEKIIKKYEYADYAFVFFEEDYAYSSEIFQKDDNGWFYENFLGKIEVSWCGNYSVAIDYRSEKYNSIMIMKVRSTGIEAEIVDSIDSSFDYIKNDKDSIYIAITEKDIPDDYEITINGKKCNFFENTLS